MWVKTSNHTEKYIRKNESFISLQESNLRPKVTNHSFALSLSVKGKKRILAVSEGTLWN